MPITTAILMPYVLTPLRHSCAPVPLGILVTACLALMMTNVRLAQTIVMQALCVRIRRERLRVHVTLALPVTGYLAQCATPVGTLLHRRRPAPSAPSAQPIQTRMPRQHAQRVTRDRMLPVVALSARHVLQALLILTHQRLRLAQCATLAHSRRLELWPAIHVLLERQTRTVILPRHVKHALLDTTQRRQLHLACRALLEKQTLTLMQRLLVTPATLGNILTRLQQSAARVLVAQLISTLIRQQCARPAPLVPSLLVVKVLADHVLQALLIWIVTLAHRAQNVSRGTFPRSRLPRALCVQLAT